METKELLEHMNDISQREQEYRDNPLHGLSPFYNYLEQHGYKDENNIYYIPDTMLQAGSGNLNNNRSNYFWDTLGSNSANFVIKKATRFYREPFMYGNFIALRYVYSGKCHLYAPNQELILNANDLIILNSGFVMSQELGENDHVFTMMINHRFIRQYLLRGAVPSNSISDLFLDYISNSESMQKYIIFHGGNNNHIRTVIEEILCNQFDWKDYSESLMESLLKILFLYLSDCPTEHSQQPRKSARAIAGIINYTNQNYRDISLKELETKFGYNAKYISRLFASIMGVSFKDYILNLRMENFCRNLVSSTDPVDKLIADEGITNESYFYAKFRERHGISPQQYRRQKAL